MSGFSAAKEVAPAANAGPGRPGSYTAALKSSAVIGGASVINMGMTLVRTKLLSLLVGPSGLGLMSLLNGLASTANTIAAVGINGSGVRQIAEACGSGDEKRIALTVATLRRTSWVLGIAGTLVLALGSGPITQMVFGNRDQQLSVAIVSITVFLTVVQGAQAALLQGMRRIRELALLNILGGLFATVCSVPLVYFWGTKGIAPFLVCAAVLSLLVSWVFARRVKTGSARPAAGEVRGEVAALLKLGSAMLISAVVSNLSMLWIRSVVMHHGELDAVGVYQAGSGLALTYVTFVLQAMGMDFYPRLTQVAKDRGEAGRLVNEQAEISLLLSLPGIMATLVLAPLAIHVLYSQAFLAATPVLKWHLIGVLLRVMSWPLSYLLLARGEALSFALLELFSGLVQVVLVWIGVKHFGLVGTGMAFTAFYALYFGFLTAFTGGRFGFRWSRTNIWLFTVALAAVAVVWQVMDHLPTVGGYAFGVSATLVLGGLCVNHLHVQLGRPALRDFGRLLRRGAGGRA